MRYLKMWTDTRQIDETLYPAQPQKDRGPMLKRFIVDVDPEIWKRVKAKAALEGRTLRSVVETLLLAWLGE